MKVPGSVDNRRWIAWAYCAVLAIVLLAPFEFYRPVERRPNGVAWLANGFGIELSSDGIVRSEKPASGLRRAMVSPAGFSVEAWVAPAGVEQAGPARIVTYSLDKSLRNFTLAQAGETLVFRLRTTRTGPNGNRPQTTVDGVFTDTDPTHLLVTYDHVTMRIYVDGLLASEVPGTGGRLDNWNDGYRLALGNELTGNRPWHGRVYRAALYRRAIPAEEIERARANGSFVHPDRAGGAPIGDGCIALYMFDEGEGAIVRDLSDESTAVDLTIPEQLEVANEPFLHPPYRYVDFRAPEIGELAEIAGNVALFVPFGFLFGFTSGSRRRTAVAVAIVLGGILASLGAEVTQYFIPGRESSMGDVLHNGIGAALGVALAGRAYFSRTPEILPR